MNLMLAMPEYWIKLIIDGSGALYDPIGLNSSAKILQADLERYDPAALNQADIFSIAGSIEPKECASYKNRLRETVG